MIFIPGPKYNPDSDYDGSFYKTSPLSDMLFTDSDQVYPATRDNISQEE
jgi:hypothetical protein